jgi:nucleoside-diphosphate-sugar epimerase
LIANMAETKSILLFGATGLIGTHILDAILEAQPPFQKVGVFTSAETAKSKSQRLEYLKSKDVQVHIGDFSNADDVSKAYTAGYDTIVSAFGRPIIDKQILLIELAEKTPTIKKYFPSEYGTDIEYGPQSKDEPPHQLKLRVRKYIQDAVKRLEYTYLVTGPFAEGYIDINRGDPGSGSIDVKAKKAVLLGDGKGRISLTTMPE